MAHLVDEISLGAIVQVRDRLLEQQRLGRKVLRLESGDPSFDIPVHVREAIEKALRDGHTHYTASTGIPALREAIFRKITFENGLHVPNPDHIVVTNGAMHGLYVIFRALLDPGDEVILPDPMWTEIGEHIRLAGGFPRPVRLRAENDYLWQIEEVKAAVGPRTRAIYINTPHNPTGAVLRREHLQALVDLAVQHNLMLVSDEAYEHVLFDGERHVSIGSLDGAQERTISVFSMSKTYAMSGLRLGYVIIPQPFLLERLKKLVRCTINGVNSITQYGALAALTGPQDATQAMAAEYQKRRDILFAALERSPYVRAFKPKGAFYLWARITEDWPGYGGQRDDWSMTNYLIDSAGIGSSPGSAFGAAGEGHIRFAFSCSTEQIEEAAMLLPEVLRRA
ncbi:MAG: pyridoxal phosphate-dependent aminotransferase [Anaerolineales bacterium]|nr:pyridoxal phosphate-dependent aminotransferase [Anaerolineales bacterium]MCX7608657.1 pyridoxal phosphate-dependent aminotransferase [Anaerolineales bacterium]MDW8226225.1 pyridoxal phosphate-dependent aminotransferase [Anaerolineales bacterium]